MLGAKGTRHGRGACGANGAAPSAATRDEVMESLLAWRIEYAREGCAELLDPLDLG